MDVPAVAGVALSVCGRDAAGRVVAEHAADVVRPVASVGKVLLLCTVADELAGGGLDPRVALRRTDDDAVADSGLWQHLRADALPVADLAVLVGAVSDNLATNVLLRHVGLPAVARTAARFGLRRTGMHDRVRDVRGPDDPPDGGVRADVGHVGAGAGARSYAVLAQWDPAGPVAAADVLDALRAVGAALLRPPRPRTPRAR